MKHYTITFRVNKDSLESSTQTDTEIPSDTFVIKVEENFTEKIDRNLKIELVQKLALLTRKIIAFNFFQSESPPYLKKFICYSNFAILVKIRL